MLSELIASGCIPVVRIERIYRQSRGSRIVTNAKLIRSGNLALEYGEDFQFYESSDLGRSAELLEKLYLRELDEFGVDNVALLTPFRQKTATCVNALNSLLRDKVNPPGEGKSEVSHGKRRFRLGDKVMQLKNYEQVSNGDVGYVTGIGSDGGDAVLTIDFGDGRLMEYSGDELEIDNGTFIPPSNVTVEDFLNDFVELYGSKKWGLSAWTSNTGLIRNYILPLLAGKCVQDITPRTVDLFIHELQRTKPVESFRKSKQGFVTACTIEKIVKLMRTAFRQAVRWGLIGSNPFDNAVLPKREKKERAIWDVKTIRKALDECEDGRLFIALNLAFACSMRLGEITGLQWDCVDISDRAIANDDASIRIERELERVDQEAINALGNADIIMVFPRVMAKKSKTRLVLKKPKTDTSIRKVWIPKTLALILREWRQRQEAWKEFMGEDYVDYNLVLAQENGRPCEDRIIGNAFARLKEKADLPDVVFHSLRHSSTTYKLKINHGDIKATQGDTGHVGPEMVTKVYAHILDEDRKINAQKFEAAFYSNPDMRQIEAQSAQKSLPPATADLGDLIRQLQEQPGLASTLAQLLNGAVQDTTG